MNNIVSVVFKKEIKDMLRDKKTLITSILLPLLIFPILSFVMGKSINGVKEDVTKNLKVVVQDNSSSKIGEYLKSQNNIKIIKSENPKKDVKEGNILASIEIPKDFDESIKENKTSNVKIFYDNSSQKSNMAMSTIKSIIDQYSKEVVAKRLKEKNIDIKILTPVNIEKQSLEKEDSGIGKIMLSMMIPLLLLLYSATGPLATATDLGAGEKERGTLEPLLTTKANRTSILTGKLMAITFMGIVTSIAAMIGLYIAMIQKNGMFAFNGKASVGMSTEAILIIGIIAILTTMVFGALELSVSIYARSFKEAQTYLIPFTVIPMIVAYGSYMIEAKNMPIYYFNIPLFNVTCVIKEVVNGVYNYVHIGLTMGWSIVYIAAAIIIAKIMFNREEVIFRT